MRLSIGPSGYLCELHPLGPVPKDQSANKTEYVIWWKGDGDDGRGLIATSPFLRSLRKIKKPFSVVLNEVGEVMR